GEFARATGVDRAVAGMERRAAGGGGCGGTRPYGYRAGSQPGTLAVDAGEAPLVGEIFGLYIRDGLGTHVIANRLNDAGHRTRGGRPWSFKVILQLLRNRT